jgi:hypothetical protein
MNILSTKLHGVLDYLVAIVFIAVPTILNIDVHTVAAKVFIYLGILTTVYSALTRYELGLIKVLPMKVHLLLDIISGIFLAASPWLFGFADVLYLPYILLGLFEVVVSCITKSSTGKAEI